MKGNITEYTRELETRARHYMRLELKSTSQYEQYHMATLALCRVVGDFTGEDRWRVYERLDQSLNEGTWLWKGAEGVE